MSALLNDLQAMGFVLSLRGHPWSSMCALVKTHITLAKKSIKFKLPLHVSWKYFCP